MNKKLTTLIYLFSIITLTLNAQPDWHFVNTGENHTILIHETAKITIDGKPIQPGDIISVFYEKNSDDGKTVLMNAGGTGKGSRDPQDNVGVVWTGQTTATAAWGSQKDKNNGFAVGEEFKWKIYRKSDGKIFDAIATYMTDARIPDAGKYKKDGISRLGTLTAVTKGKK